MPFKDLGDNIPSTPHGMTPAQMQAYRCGPNNERCQQTVDDILPQPATKENSLGMWLLLAVGAYLLFGR